MGLASLGEISRNLIAAGLPVDTPAALIGNGTRPNQQVVRCTLRQLPSMADEQQLTPPTLTVIGRVVGCFSGAQPMSSSMPMIRIGYRGSGFGIRVEIRTRNPRPETRLPLPHVQQHQPVPHAGDSRVDASRFRAMVSSASSAVSSSS